MPIVKVDDINIFYKIFSGKNEVGVLDPDAKTMIVLHGGFGILDHQIEVSAWLAFSSHGQVIFIDQRGCGLSEDGEQDKWTMDQFGDDIFNFSKALNINKPIVAGVSSGGYAAIAYATRHPEHPGALILLNTEPAVSPDAKKEAYSALGRRDDKREFSTFKKLSDSEIEAYTDKAAIASYQYDLNPTAENFEKFAEYGFSIISKARFDLTPPVRQNMEMKKIFANGYQKFNYLSDMEKITCPVLWFAGEWDPLHPLSCAVEGSKKLSHVELNILKAGAPVYQDDPDNFYQRIFAFFENDFEL